MHSTVTRRAVKCMSHSVCQSLVGTAEPITITGHIQLLLRLKHRPCLMHRLSDVTPVLVFMMTQKKMIMFSYLAYCCGYWLCMRYTLCGQGLDIIIIKGIYIAQVRKGHKCAMDGTGKPWTLADILRILHQSFMSVV